MSDSAQTNPGGVVTSGPGGGPATSQMFLQEDGGFSGIMGMTIQDYVAVALLQNPSLNVLWSSDEEELSLGDFVAKTAMQYIEAREQ